MARRFLLGLLMASAMSAAPLVSAAGPAGAEPAQPLNERITDSRIEGVRPGKDADADDGLDSTGPAQPRGLAPAAPQPDAGPAECRRLPRDARQACMEGANRSRGETPALNAPGIPSPKAAPESQAPRPGLGGR